MEQLVKLSDFRVYPTPGSASSTYDAEVTLIDMGYVARGTSNDQLTAAEAVSNAMHAAVALHAVRLLRSVVPT